MTIATATTSSDAPPPGPLMSQAVVCNGMVYCSGSLGLDPKTGEFVEGTVADRAVGRNSFAAISKHKTQYFPLGASSHEFGCRSSGQWQYP